MKTKLLLPDPLDPFYVQAFEEFKRFGVCAPDNHLWMALQHVCAHIRFVAGVCDDVDVLGKLKGVEIDVSVLEKSFYVVAEVCLEKPINIPSREVAEELWMGFRMCSKTMTLAINHFFNYIIRHHPQVSPVRVEVE